LEIYGILKLEILSQNFIATERKP